jgi:hypothetical protein
MLQSLSQPAILPSSTDFLVPLRELQDEEKFEIQGNYSLIIDPKVRLSLSLQVSPADSFLSRLALMLLLRYVCVCVAQVCAFDTPEHLLTEMICQRLAQVPLSSPPYLGPIQAPV